ncbi:hypothetical protein BT96DRAFT_986221 [Gymnopus androsaceus JB14]|uniref:Uncharacterized protein n=1 Tax=Gymnopus androsaceus JB14 TaxID=1447944 RepID=A0A6A4IBG3_9AGAR|nr:hypothetical protein BT96DRAFT_986221 [Gymnopus androsaceus JB14]
MLTLANGLMGFGWWSTHSISLFTADQKRAGSVVSARIKFSGIYYYNPLIMEPLQESLKKLSNLTHAYLCFFEASSGETDEEILSPLELVLQSLPRLKNIYVDAYAAGKEFFLRWSFLTQNLEVIELCEGSGEDYYWRNIHRSDSFRSYMGPGDENDMGIRYLLNETRLQAGYFKRLRRLHVISDLKRGEESVPKAKAED